MTKSKFAEKNEKISGEATGCHKKIEERAVCGLARMTDAFVDVFLMKNGETLSEAKGTIKKGQQKR